MSNIQQLGASHMRAYAQMSEVTRRRAAMLRWLDKADEARARGDERMAEAYDYAAMVAGKALATALRSEAVDDREVRT